MYTVNSTVQFAKTLRNVNIKFKSFGEMASKALNSKKIVYMKYEQSFKYIHADCKRTGVKRVLLHLFVLYDIFYVTEICVLG